MPTNFLSRVALIGLSLSWCACAGSDGSPGAPGTGGSTTGTGGGAGTSGAAGTSGGGGTVGSGGSTGGGGQAGASSMGTAGASGTAGAGGAPTGTGGSGGGHGGAAGRGGATGTAGSGTPGTGGRGGYAGSSTGTAGSAGSGSGSAGSAAGRGGSSNGGTGTAGTGGSSTTGAGGLPGSYDTEDTGADCAKPPAPPAFSALPSVTNLPDPFLMTSGTRISKVADWRCRRAEIKSQIEYWGSGPKGAPPTSLTATLSGGKLSVTVTQGGATVNLSGTLSTPSGSGPFPLVIGMNTPTGSLPSSLFNGVATLTFQSSQLVPDAFNVPRGGGTYFTMYPDKNAGAMIEWAWGVSRLIDGLYKTADTNKIDLKRIAVTGCSYQGKMALYAGAFDERIALTIPEESGGGGEASWRFMATQTGTEDLEAAQGTAWYAQNLLQFKNKDAPKLPYDQHELVAMIAPRAVLAVENTGIDRLGSQAGSVSMRAATEVWKALGVPDRIGYTQAQASAHCSFPASVQSPDVQAFIDKFLLNKTTANTAVARDSYHTDLTKWVTWTTPTLQ
jgi:hypothetical protein